MARVWLVDKPAGPTSHDIVSGIRRQLGRKVKVGHAGTLDPFATGLLVVLVGRATRLSQYLIGLDKSYITTIALGERSESGDPEGPISPGSEVPPREVVEGAVAALVGVSEQLVPALSAVKVDGEALYRRTRRGETDIELPRREVTISSVNLIELSPDRKRLTLGLSVSKGTYIRQVATDLGEALGCGGYCLTLRRTSIGTLSLNDACDPDEVTTSGGLPAHEALAHLPARELTDDEAQKMAHGVAVEGDHTGPMVLTHEGAAVAIARGDGERLRPEVVLT